MQCGQNGALKGDFKVLTAAKIADYSLDIVEFLIKVNIVSFRKRTSQEETTIK